MRINFSRHAELQLKERNMPKQLIKSILFNPQQALPAKKGRKIAQSIVELDGIEFVVRVIYIQEKEFYEVLTAYKTRKIGKYWRT